MNWALGFQFLGPWVAALVLLGLPSKYCRAHRAVSSSCWPRGLSPGGSQFPEYFLGSCVPWRPGPRFSFFGTNDVFDFFKSLQWWLGVFFMRPYLLRPGVSPLSHQGENQTVRGNGTAHLRLCLGSFGRGSPTVGADRDLHHQFSFLVFDDANGDRFTLPHGPPRLRPFYGVRYLRVGLLVGAQCHHEFFTGALGHRARNALALLASPRHLSLSFCFPLGVAKHQPIGRASICVHPIYLGGSHGARNRPEPRCCAAGRTAPARFVVGSFFVAWFAFFWS